MSSQNRPQGSTMVLPSQGNLWEGKWAPEPTPSSLLTPPVRSDSDTMLMPPPFPKRRRSSSSKCSSQRVVFQEITFSQTEMRNAPEEEFFLVGPKEVFSSMDMDAPMLVRPRPQRAGEENNEPFSVTLTSALFRSIEEEMDDDGRFFGETESPPPALLRLKPRPAALKDGQRPWTSL